MLNWVIPLICPLGWCVCFIVVYGLCQLLTGLLVLSLMLFVANYLAAVVLIKGAFCLSQAYEACYPTSRLSEMKEALSSAQHNTLC